MWSSKGKLSSFQFGPPKTIGIFRTVPTFSRKLFGGILFKNSYLSIDKYQNGDVTNLTPETESWTDFLKKKFRVESPTGTDSGKKNFLRPNPGKNHLK